MTVTTPHSPTVPSDGLLTGSPEAQLRIDVLRNHIDAVDSAIIRLVNERVELSRKVGAIRTASGGPRLSLRRENQIIAKFVAALGAEGTTLAMLLLRTSRGRL